MFELRDAEQEQAEHQNDEGQRPMSVPHSRLSEGDDATVRPLSPQTFELWLQVRVPCNALDHDEED
jgi:hypothetical protein